MTRYYFDVRDSKGFHRDDVGDEFDSFEEAREQAQILLPDIAREELPDGDLYTITCNVRDDTDSTIYYVELTLRGTRFPQGA
jgi:hypothetical protein